MWKIFHKNFFQYITAPRPLFLTPQKTCLLSKVIVHTEIKMFFFFLCIFINKKCKSLRFCKQEKNHVFIKSQQKQKMTNHTNIGKLYLSEMKDNANNSIGKFCICFVQYVWNKCPFSEKVISV